MERIKIYTLGIFAFIIITLLWLYNDEKEERQRLEVNQATLLTGIHRYKTADSLNAVKIQSLELTKQEFKEYETELLDSLKKLNIKIKRLESYMQVSTETKIEFKTVLKDSLIYLPGKDSIISLKCMEYINPWIDFRGCYESDTFNAKIEIPVNLDIIAHRVPKQFLFFKFGVKSVDIDIISLNPYTEIAYAKSITLKK